MSPTSPTRLPDLPPLHLVRQLWAATHEPSAPLWLRVLCQHAATEFEMALSELAYHAPELATTLPLYRLIDGQIDRERQAKERVVLCDCQRHADTLPLAFDEETLQTALTSLRGSAFALNHPELVAPLAEAVRVALASRPLANQWAALTELLGVSAHDVDGAFDTVRRLATLAGRDHALFADALAFSKYAASVLASDSPVTREWKAGFLELGEPLQARLDERLTEVYPRPNAPTGDAEAAS